MCHKDHELAAVGTMSWPELRVFGSIKWPKLQAGCLDRDFGRCFVFMRFELEVGLGRFAPRWLWAETGSVGPGTIRRPRRSGTINLAEPAIGWS
jgi:hypothetical protein